jgi:hypothetical protein
MRRIEILEGARMIELLRQRDAMPDDEDLEPRTHLAIRMLHGQIISAMLHGPGPYAVDDPRLHRELALMLYRYVGLEAADASR